MLVAICLSFLAVCILSAPIILLGKIGNSTTSALILALTSCVVIAGILLAKKGCVKQSAILTPISMSVLVHLSIFASHGLNFFLYFAALTPFLTGLLTRRRFILPHVLLNIALLWLAYGYMPEFSNHSPLHPNFVPVLTLFHLATGALSYLSSYTNAHFFYTLISTQDALKQARQEAIEANLAKSHFLANMSHELRTPLNAIIGYSEIMIEEGELDDLPPQHIADAQRINKSGKHLLVLINGLLDLAKIEAGKMSLDVTSFSLQAVMDEMVETSLPLVQANHNTLVISPSPLFESKLLTDEIKLKQILLNLLSNAAKFTSDGTITISAEENKNHSNFITLHVTDTGIGIPEDRQQHIFEDFVQASTSTTRLYGGTGLGLSLCIKFAQMLKGHMSLASAPHVGSTFSLHIPMDVTQMADPPQD